MEKSYPIYVTEIVNIIKLCLTQTHINAGVNIVKIKEWVNCPDQVASTFACDVHFVGQLQIDVYSFRVKDNRVIINWLQMAGSNSFDVKFSEVYDIIPDNNIYVYSDSENEFWENCINAIEKAVNENRESRLIKFYTF